MFFILPVIKIDEGWGTQNISLLLSLTVNDTEFWRSLNSILIELDTLVFKKVP